MGSNSSRNSNYSDKNYNQMIHGPIQVYMMQVEAEYELECIPLGFRGNK